MTTLEKAIATYGKDMQLNVAIEEFSELTKEICKHKRGSDNLASIIEEMADCYIMLEEMQIIFDLNGETVANEIIRKVERLEKRLEEKKGANYEQR